MQWSNKAVEKLISQYRAHPCLYNTRMKEYRDQTVKKQAYAYIMNSLQDVRRGTTVDEIKSKINSLRSAYSQDYAKMNANANYKSNKWYFQLLDAFLKDFTRNASRERNRSASRDSVSEIDSTVDGDNTRDSFLMRSNMSTPLSFYGINTIGRESPIFVSRGRSGFPSPAPSLYGQEAEPFTGQDFNKQPESRSCESVSSEGAQYFSIPKTLSGIDPSIFDQPTLLDIEVSPVPSPVGDSGVFEQRSVIRSSIVPSPNVSPIPKEDSGMDMRNSSPIRKLFVDDNEVQIAREIMVPFGSQKGGVKETDSAQKENGELVLPRPSTSKEVEVRNPKIVPVPGPSKKTDVEVRKPEIVSMPGPSKEIELEVVPDVAPIPSTSKEIPVVPVPGPTKKTDIEVRKPEIVTMPGPSKEIEVQIVPEVIIPPKEMKSSESQTENNLPPDSVTIENNRVELEPKDQPGPSTVNHSKNSEPRPQEEPKPGPSRVNDNNAAASTKIAPEIQLRADDVKPRREDPLPGPSRVNDTNEIAPTKTAEEVQPGPTKSKRKPYKTVCTYESDSDSEFFSAGEEPYSPVKKKRKLSQVSHYYYEPQQKLDNVNDALLHFIALRYNAVKEEFKAQVATKLVSAFEGY